MDSFDSYSVRCVELAQSLVIACSKKGLTVATAESLTAGMVSSFIASVSGASEVLMGGAVTYTNDIKAAVLGVSPETICQVTEVSSEVACQMAQGAARLFSSNLAVSLTGYAGPGGGTEQNPVGTVFIGLMAEDKVSARRFVFQGDRQEVRVQAAEQALLWLLSSIESM